MQFTGDRVDERLRGCCAERQFLFNRRRFSYQVVFASARLGQFSKLILIVAIFIWEISNEAISGSFLVFDDSGFSFR
jgi:hypothetical protein